MAVLADAFTEIGEWAAIGIEKKDKSIFFPPFSVGDISMTHIGNGLRQSASQSIPLIQYDSSRDLGKLVGNSGVSVLCSTYGWALG